MGLNQYLVERLFGGIFICATIIFTTQDNFPEQIFACFYTTCNTPPKSTIISIIGVIDIVIPNEDQNPPKQSQASYEMSAVPPIHHRWVI